MIAVSPSRPSSAKIAWASGVRSAASRRHSLGEPVAQALVPLGRVQHAAHDELRRDGAVPLVRLEPEDDVVAPHLAEPVELRAETEGDRAPGIASAVADAEAQVLAVADRGQVAELAGRQEQRDARVREPERRQAAELLAEVERELPARDDRVDDRSRAQVVVRQRGVGVSREGLGERVDLGRVDREARGGSMSAEPLEMLGAGGEAAVEVERARRAARALPVPIRARDQHDRAVEALDEPGRDDPDHALVPGLVGEHVAAAAPVSPPATRRSSRTPRARSGPRLPAARGSAPRAGARAGRPRPCPR